MILPPNGTDVFEHDYEIVQRKNTFYQQCITPTLALWEQANTDTLYYCGSAQLWSGVYGNLPAYARKNFNFNFIKPSVEMVAGRQCQNRKTSIVTPRENASQRTADEATKVLDIAFNEDQTYEKISKAFKGGALITGINWIQLSLDYRKDPVSGDLTTMVRPYNSVIADPYWTKLDGSDCQGMIVRDFLTKRALISMFPDKEDIILGLPVNGYGNSRDGKFQYTPQNYDYGVINLMTYDQFFYRDFRRQKLLLDVNTGESFEWKGTEKDASDKLKFILQQEPTLTVIEQDVPTVRMELFVQDRCLYDGPTGLGDTYPMIPFVGYYHPEIPYYEWRTQSLVRGMRDTQFLYNRFVINMADVVESQVNSGWKYKEDALVDPNDVFLSGQGKGLALKKDAQMSDVEKIIPTEASQTAFKLADTFLNLRGVVSGINEELLGSAQDDVAGVLSQLRQGAGLTTLQTLFDNLDHSQKLLSERALEIIRNNYVPAKIKRMLGGQEPSGWWMNKEFGTYDIVIEEGFNTATQKQMQYAQLLQARELLGDEIPTKTIIDAMTIQNKDRLMQDIAERQQQKQQMEQAQAQAAMQVQQAQSEYFKSKAFADQGSGAERFSRVEENRALAIEKIHEARREDTQAALNQAKTLKEFQGMDLEEINKLVAIAAALRALEAPEVEDIKKETTIPQAAQGVPGVNRGV